MTLTITVLLILKLKIGTLLHIIVALLAHVLL